MNRKQQEAEVSILILIIIIIKYKEGESDTYIESEQFLVIMRIHYNHQANVVGIDVNRVVARNSHSCFEFARQILFPIEWFGLIVEDDTITIVYNKGIVRDKEGRSREMEDGR